MMEFSKSWLLIDKLSKTNNNIILLVYIFCSVYIAIFYNYKEYKKIFERLKPEIVHIYDISKPLWSHTCTYYVFMREFNSSNTRLYAGIIRSVSTRLLSIWYPIYCIILFIKMYNW